MNYKAYEVEPNVSIRYAEAGDPAHALIVLIHGYPQTSHMYSKVLEPLASKGYHVLAPDYRGAGESSMPESGYDKWTMSRDIHTLYTKGLGREKAVIVGIDIGSMVATALALQFRDDVLGLFASECPQPGTSLYDASVTDDYWKFDKTYHFFFHNAPNNWAENLTVGKERYYINTFFERLAKDPKFMPSDDLDVYSKSFEGWDRMRAGFEVYRAFKQDVKDVREDIAKNGKLKMPVLASGGDASIFVNYSKDMMSELAENVEHEGVKGAGHWIPEEAPEEFVKVLSGWLERLKLERTT